MSSSSSEYLSDISDSNTLQPKDVGTKTDVVFELVDLETCLPMQELKEILSTYSSVTIRLMVETRNNGHLQLIHFF